MKLKQYKLRKVIMHVAAAISILILYIQADSRFVPEKPIVKNINLKIYKSSGYLSNIYNDASAKICITITKVGRSSRVTVWAKTFGALQLKQYPSIEDALLQKVAIKGVFDRMEHLEIRSTVSYNANGNVLEIKEGVLLSKGTTDGTLTIPI